MPRHDKKQQQQQQQCMLSVLTRPSIFILLVLATYLDLQKFVEESKRTLRRAGEVLPEGFFNAIYATHIAKAEVDYLPTVPNLPQPHPVGRVKPRSAAEDWFAIGFDPWSAGKDPLSREFIPTLMTREESLLEQQRKRAATAQNGEGEKKDTESCVASVGGGARRRSRRGRTSLR